MIAITLTDFQFQNIIFACHPCLYNIPRILRSHHDNLLFLQMEVELDDFEDGRPVLFKTSAETGVKIKLLKAKANYAELLEVAEAMPGTREKYMLKANCLLHLRKWKELAQACDNGLDLASEEESADFLNLKGRAVGKLGDFQQKVNLTTKAIELNNKVAAYHRNLGAAFYKLKNYEKAIESHNRAIKLEPKHAINYHNKGAAYFRLLDYPNALKCFEKAVELDRKQTLSFVWMGDTLKEMQSYQRAKQYYMRAYELSDKQQYKKAVREMEEKINPQAKKGFFARIFG